MAAVPPVHLQTLMLLQLSKVQASGDSDDASDAGIFWQCSD